MNLLEVIADGAPGGGTTMLLGLIDDLIATRGWRPAVVSQPGSYLEQEIVRRGLRFVPFDFFGPMFDPSAPIRLARALHGFDHPIAHVHGLRAAHHALAWPARGRFGPLVYTVHGIHQLHLPWPRPLKALANAAERRVARRADRIVYVSQADRRLALDHRLFDDPSKVEVIHNGVACAELVPRGADAAAFDVVFVGRFVEAKAPEVAAEVLARLASVGLRCAMAGDGPLRGRCRSLLERLPGGESVQLLGELARDASIALIRSSRLLLVTSRWEGLPLAPIEAMALGVPVVAPRIPGIDEVIDDGISGRLLDAPTVDDYAEALAALAADPTGLAAMAERAVARARLRFDRSGSSARYGMLYESLAHPGPAACANGAAVRP